MLLHRFPISNKHHLGEFLTIYHETRKDPRLHHASVRFVHKRPMLILKLDQKFIVYNNTIIY